MDRRGILLRRFGQAVADTYGLNYYAKTMAAGGARWAPRLTRERGRPPVLPGAVPRRFVRYLFFDKCCGYDDPTDGNCAAEWRQGWFVSSVLPDISKASNLVRAACFPTSNACPAWALQ